MPILLTDDQKLQWFPICEEYPQRSKLQQKYFEKATTGDATWVYIYDIVTKQQPSHLKRSAYLISKKLQQARSLVKPVLFFNHQGIVHYEFAPGDHTVN